MVECIICYEDITKDTGCVRLKCKHEYCAPCFAKHMRVSNQCAMCRKDVTDTPHPPREEDDTPQGDVVWDIRDDPEIYNMFFGTFMTPNIVGQVIERPGPAPDSAPTPANLNRMTSNTPVNPPLYSSGAAGVGEAFARWSAINDSNISLMYDIFRRNT